MIGLPHMGAMADLYAARMRGPEPDEGDEWVMTMARAIRARHERAEQRAQRVLAALGIHEMIEEEPLYVG